MTNSMIKVGIAQPVLAAEDIERDAPLGIDPASRIRTCGCCTGEQECTHGLGAAHAGCGI